MLQDTVMFPVNWMMIRYNQMGVALCKDAKKRDMGIIVIKGFIRQRGWKDRDERTASGFPKAWCMPFDADEKALGVAALKYTFR